jgi:hypothetical protein
MEILLPVVVVVVVVVVGSSFVIHGFTGTGKKHKSIITQHHSRP